MVLLETAGHLFSLLVSVMFPCWFVTSTKTLARVHVTAQTETQPCSPFLLWASTKTPPQSPLPLALALLSTLLSLLLDLPHYFHPPSIPFLAQAT